ncbi:hypothetical protein JCM14719A_16200 [Calditerricola satsumensis]|uniref:Uncharacterized protein n=1 Tax=Calditerricola satsumensis TaxID=373054 RepID=A0A8J3FA14_9BACI|nr:hypothetical protein GCM10007043_00350 [Calditerricola satsumensis]
MALTAAHWLYAAITAVILVIMLFRRGIVLPSLVGTFLVAWVYKGSVVEGLKAIFNANLVAAKELFNIFLIIAFMVALLHALRDLGADRHMVKPVQKIMNNGHIGYWIIAFVTYMFSDAGRAADRDVARPRGDSRRSAGHGGGDRPGLGRTGDGPFVGLCHAGGAGPVGQGGGSGAWRGGRSGHGALPDHGGYRVGAGLFSFHEANASAR